MLQNSLTIIMYHYVHDIELTDFPKIKALSVARFREQLDKLSKNYELFSARALQDFMEGKMRLSDDAYLLTFDDGLKDHYQNIFPMLAKRNLRAIFFPITSTFEGRVADVHKIHFLLAKLGAEQLVFAFHNFLDGQIPQLKEKYFISSQEKIDPKYRFDDVLTANLKVTMQILPDDLRTRFLSELFRKVIGQEQDFAAKLYLSREEIKEMSAAGQIFGSHTHTHRRLDKLTKGEQLEELKKSKEILGSVTGERVGIVSYPYGEYNDDILDLARQVGYDIGLGTEVGVNTPGTNKLTLKRLNANDI